MGRLCYLAHNHQNVKDTNICAKEDMAIKSTSINHLMSVMISTEQRTKVAS